MWARGRQGWPHHAAKVLYYSPLLQRTPWAEGPSCYLHPVPPPTAGGQVGCAHRWRRLRPKGLGLSGVPTQGVTRHLSHAHPKLRGPIPSGASHSPSPFYSLSSRPALQSREGAAAEASRAAERRVPEGRSSPDSGARAPDSKCCSPTPLTAGPRCRAVEGRVAKRYLPWTWVPGCRTA